MLWHSISGMVQWDQAKAYKNRKVGISHAAEELLYLLWRGCDGVWTEFDRGDSVFRTVYWAPHCILQRTEELLLCTPHLSGKTTQPIERHSRYWGSCLAKQNTPVITCLLSFGSNISFVYSVLQDFMAALYVFTIFRSESKNVLDSEWLHMPNIFISKPDQTRSVASLLLRGVELTLRAPLGRYDMFLRFLCGLLSPDCHDQQLGGFLFPNDAAKVSGLDEAQQLLQHMVTTAQQNTDRVENLKECLREMMQLHKWAAWWTLAWLDYLACFIGKVQPLFCKYQHWALIKNNLLNEWTKVVTFWRNLISDTHISCSLFIIT